MTTVKFTRANTLNRKGLLASIKRDAEPNFYYSNLSEVRHTVSVRDGKLYTIIQHPCHRCGGTGIYSQYHGVCYECGGHGRGKVEKRRVYTRPTAEKLVARAEKAAATRAAKKAAELEARKVESRQTLNVDITDEFKLELAKAKLTVTTGTTDLDNEYAQKRLGTLASIIESGEQWGWSEKRRAAITDILEAISNLRTAAKRAAIAAENRDEWIKEGRYVIEGEVVSCKEKETEWGTAWKLVITDGVRKWYGTLPRALDIPERGDTIKIKATVSRANDDPLFGWYKRPAAA